MTTERRKTFYAVYNILNENILKETGMLSYGMMKYHGYDSCIATCSNDSYPNLKYLPGLRMEFIAKHTGNFIIDSSLWLMRNAKRIDVLFLMHPVIRSVCQALSYKLFNPRGKVYLKFDGFYRARHRGSLWKRPLYRWLVNHSACVSTELKGDDEFLSQDWERRIVFVPNPANPHELEDFRPFSERSDIIMYAGRIERDKGSHVLLEAFAQISSQIPNWSLVLAGSITEQDIVDNFRKDYPHLNNRVIFAGLIKDRKKLVEMYRDSKIFAFPSRHEGCPLALSEALLFGVFAVTSNIPPHKSMTDNFKYALGSEIDDVNGLAQNLLHACTHEHETEVLAREGMTAARKRLDLKHCCDVIAEELNNSN